MKRAALIAVVVLSFLTFWSLNGCKGPDTDSGGATHEEAPRTLTWSIGHVYPHDTSAFTEGILIYKDGLYESTGLEGKSKLMEVDLKTGRAKRSINLDSNYFGEGISIIRDT